MGNEDRLIEHLPQLYDISLGVMREFGGPSVHFHVRAIAEQQRSFLSDAHIEMVYATLASWGMHKMGDPAVTRTKMVDYPAFRDSILNQRERLYSLRDVRMESCSPQAYEDHIEFLHHTYQALRVSVSEATVVAHSKTLAHILPNLVPPIDRQYTIRFFTQQNDRFFTQTGNWRLVNLPPDREEQFDRFKEYAVRIKTILSRCDLSQFTLDSNNFNTSYPKIADNLIMAYVKEVARARNMVHQGVVADAPEARG